MSARLSIRQGLCIAVAAVVVAIVPFGLGRIFYLGAVVVTPVVMVVLLLLFGAAISLTVPTGRWFGVALATVVISAVYAVLPALMTGGRAPAKIMYVVLPRSAGLAFPEALAKLLKGRGVDAELAQSLPVDDDDRTITRGLSATKDAVYLVSYNTQMSGFAGGYPDGRCLPAGESPRPDPDQYLIMVYDWVPCAGTESSTLYDELRRDLVSRGYDVRDKQALCAAVANEPSDGRQRR